jgi:hypothetical protein
LTLQKDNPEGNFVSRLTIASYPDPVILKGISVKQFEIHSSPALFDLSNLWIDKLRIYGGPGSYYFTNCRIGTLELVGSSVRDFDFRGGIVLDIKCPPPTGESPFTGSVYFDRKVYLPRKPGAGLAGPQPYRNLRAHMQRLENAPMVSLFHSLEQAVERQNQSWFSRIIRRLYGVLSDYGSSAGRPLFWFVILLTSTFGVLFWSDGAAINQLVSQKGWYSELFTEGLTSRGWRAFVATISATVNPLGILGTTSLVVPKYAWVTVWLPIHGLLAAIFVVLFVLALRRRFKIT